MKCNGCGGEIDKLGGTFSYGGVVFTPIEGATTEDGVAAEHHRTFCPRCARVLKDIILNSDFSDHWNNE